MGKTLNRGIDGSSDKGRKNLIKQPEKIGEDMENLPKKEGVAHIDTWRYKRGWVYQKILENMMKKHVGENHNVLYAEIAKRYKTGTLERLHIERDLLSMSINGERYATLWSGYFIDEDGIIRYAQKVNGVITIIK